MAVDSSSFDAMFKKVVGFIEDENAILTYRSVCRRLDVSVDVARKLLDHYLSSKQRQHFDGPLSVVYCMSGQKTGEDLLEFVTALVIEDDADEWGKDLQNVQKQVYSIQAVELENCDPLYMADHPMNVEDIKSIRESSMIACSYVKLRVAGERRVMDHVSEVGPVTAKTLAKIEAEQKKVVTAMGDSFHALKVKGSQPTEAAGGSKQKDGDIAGWIKAGGLDPKKSHPVKEVLQSKKKLPSPVRTPVDFERMVSSDEDDCFAPKKSRNMATKLLDSDDDDEGVPTHVQDELNERIDKFDVSQSSEPTESNRTMVFDAERSPSPDEPRVLRRKATTKTQTESVKKTRNSDDEEPRKSRSKVPSSMGNLTGVSDDESDKEVSSQPSSGRPKKRPLSDDKSSERGVKSSKKTNFYGSDLEDDDAYEEAENSTSERTDEPIRQFLTTTEPLGSKKRKQVMKSYVDEEGYMVSEQVWEDEDDDKAKKPEIKAEQSSTKTKKAPKAEKVTPPPAKASGKKKEAAPSGGKSKQSSIMSFFKKSDL